jgi:hypothetical protein
LDGKILGGLFAGAFQRVDGFVGRLLRQVGEAFVE